MRQVVGVLDTRLRGYDGSGGATCRFLPRERRSPLRLLGHGLASGEEHCWKRFGNEENGG